MTKLTDIPGAKEELDIPWAINYNVHLEVDVEFLAKILSDCASDNGFDYSTHGINVLSECIATNITKWARMVRK